MSAASAPLAATAGRSRSRRSAWDSGIPHSPGLAGRHTNPAATSPLLIRNGRLGVRYVLIYGAVSYEKPDLSAGLAGWRKPGYLSTDVRRRIVVLGYTLTSTRIRTQGAHDG